jgi:hypothetical protein
VKSCQLVNLVSTLSYKILFLKLTNFDIIARPLHLEVEVKVVIPVLFFLNSAPRHEDV